MVKSYKEEFRQLLNENLLESELHWLEHSISGIKQQQTARRLYLNYSLCSTKIKNNSLLKFPKISNELREYLKKKGAHTVEISRIFMLISILEENIGLVDAVKNLIQIADNVELETFLKFLAFIPEPDNYQFAAVEALRTNVSTVFEAISKYNPYPSRYFNDQQWNQMYLKAAFIQLDLHTIVDIDARANEDLAKIISDYAHERWAASRPVDPYFWRPIPNYLNESLILDIEHLFKSENLKERYAAALVCKNADYNIAKQLLDLYPDLKAKVEGGTVTWENVKA